MTFTRLVPKLLTRQFLPDADPALCRALGVSENQRGRSLALLTADQDDAFYAALDHATKMAAVDVVYARSFYAGAAHASGPLSGEVIGVLAADHPEHVARGVVALEAALASLFAFYQVEESGVNVFFAAIGSIGRYLAAQAGLAVGQPLGYLIAPPVEALVGLDAALKAADVSLARFFGPPSETNFAGGYVTGTLSAVEAAAAAFADAVRAVAMTPRE